MDHLSQSAASTFRCCRKAAFLKYEKGITPKIEDTVLFFGRLLHSGLEFLFHHKQKGTAWDQSALTAYLATQDCKEPAHRIVAEAAVLAYARRWDDSGFDVVSIELPFDLPLINPETGAQSRTFYRNGRIDLLLRKRSDGTLWLFEHKSAARVDASYLTRLWLDFQITWYIGAVQDLLHEPVAGVIYDIVMKPATNNLAPDKGETEAEFEERRAKLKNPKAGKRKFPETMAEFTESILSFYSDPSVFHREEILISPEDVEMMRKEAWDIGQAWLDARRNDRWYRNTSYCFQWNKPCQYLPICQSRDNQLVIDASFNQVKPEDKKPEAKPIF